MGAVLRVCADTRGPRAGRTAAYRRDGRGRFGAAVLRDCAFAECTGLPAHCVSRGRTDAGSRGATRTARESRVAAVAVGRRGQGIAGVLSRGGRGKREWAAVV